MCLPSGKGRACDAAVRKVLTMMLLADGRRAVRVGNWNHNKSLAFQAVVSTERLPMT